VLSFVPSVFGAVCGSSAVVTVSGTGGEAAVTLGMKDTDWAVGGAVETGFAEASAGEVADGSGAPGNEAPGTRGKE